MLKYLKLAGVGPAATMELEFGKRLNLITGDNGLGKSFILEAAWWCLTRTWTGHWVRPSGLTKSKPNISFLFDGVAKKNTYTSYFDAEEQDWPSKKGRPANPGLVIFAKADGGFAVWDPARNYWKIDARGKPISRPPAYKFNSSEVWNGLNWQDKIVCNGLLRDWVSWQFGDTEKFSLLKRALASLSPGGAEVLEPGSPTKIDINDARQMPTLKMPYGEEVPVLFASAGMRRAIALAYLLVWAWSEHLDAARLMKKKPAKQVIFLVDEIEAHLHPKWQRLILTSLLAVVNQMAQRKDAAVQIIAATHSPLVLTSMEPVFDAKQDAWFDLDLEGENKPHVVLRRREFHKRGDVSAWLTSEAFGLATSRSSEAESALKQAQALMQPGVRPKSPALKNVELALQRALPETDPFWVRWEMLKKRHPAT